MKLLAFFSFFLLSYQLSASIVCPDDIEIGCDMDFTDLDMTGQAYAAGQHIAFTPKYIDWITNGLCGEGEIKRSWYIDINHNDEIDAFEPHCVQMIYLLDVVSPVIVEFPDDIYLTCGDDIPDSQPIWSAGPCDNIAYSTEDIYLEIGEGACTKILREFTVINWCDYEFGSDDGIWEHTQIIFFEDIEKPIIHGCEDIELATDDCEGTFTISNSASDFGFCISESIRWDVHIDLWGDGTVEYIYGTAEQGAFNIPATSNEETVTITLPEKVRKGHHKVTWKVNDGCGNVTACHMDVHMRDLKAPTPFCHIIAYTTLMSPSGFLEVSASSLVLKATDNCSPDSAIKYSFSADPADSLRQFDCTNFGFQFFQVHAIDEYGNADFCDVFMLIFDNLGSCSFNVDFGGRVADINNHGVEGARMSFYDDGTMLAQELSNNEGIYAFEELDLIRNMYLDPDHVFNSKANVNVADLLVLRDYIFGFKDFNVVESHLADINGDGKVSATDLVAFRDYILDPSIEFPSQFAIWNSRDSLYEFRNHIALEELVVQDQIYALQMGDLSEDYYTTHLSKEVAPRNKMILEYKIEDNIVSFFSSKDHEIKALQLGLGLKLKSVIDGAIKFPDSGTYLEDSSSKLIWFQDASTAIDPDVVLFQIELASSANSHISLLQNLEFASLALDAQLREYDIVLEKRSRDNNISIRQQDDYLVLTNIQNDGNAILVNTTGQQIANYSLNLGEMKIPTTSFSPGIYFIQIHLNGVAQTQTRKIFIP